MATYIENDSVDIVEASNSDNMNNAGELDSDKFELSKATEGDVICNNTPETAGGAPSNSGDDMLAEIRTNVRSQLEELKERIEGMTEIPDLLKDISLKCLEMSTLQYLSYHLDPESDIMTEGDKLKDYRGLAEWIGLENIFIRYISKANYAIHKTSEVVSKWLTRTEEPLPTLGNLQRCLKELERIDVLEDMSVKMAKDAVNWKLTELEASAGNANRTSGDTSWQLTRHDVVTGEKTMYTACLLYADEDELMAQLIIKVFKEAYEKALFFNPNFDLKAGKFVLDTTAAVITERCDHKVVFLLSEYFYASEICQFAVNYAAAHGTGNGNLIPFHLTRNIKDIPNVLTGITGIRWFRKSTRKHAWSCLAECLLCEKIDSKKLSEVSENITKLVDRDKEQYLQDPPYDEDVAPPGDPFPVVEPEMASPLPTKEDIENQILQSEQEILAKSKTEKWKLLKRVKQKIVEKVFKGSSPFRSSSYPPVEMKSVGNNNNKASPFVNGFVDTTNASSVGCAVF
ncbi:Myeloid differentiation primary response protein MyD88 [Mactra antiquata]